MPTPVLWRDLFQINPSNSSAQHFWPRTIQLESGNILIVYHTDSTSEDGSAAGYDIIGKIYNTRGDLVTGPILLNVQQSQNEWFPEIVTHNDGGFSVVYQSDGTTNSMYIDTFTDTGSLFRSDSLSTGFGSVEIRKPNISSNGLGSILITQERRDTNLDEVSLEARSYNAYTGAAGTTMSITPTFSLAPTVEDIDGHRVSTLPNGNRVVVYVFRETGTGNDVVFFQKWIENTPMSKL